MLHGEEAQRLLRLNFYSASGNAMAGADRNLSSAVYRGFSRRPCWRAETLKQFCMKIDLISQRRENVLFLPSNMAAMTSHENALYICARESWFPGKTVFPWSSGWVGESNDLCQFNRPERVQFRFILSCDIRYRRYNNSESDSAQKIWTYHAAKHSAFLLLILTEFVVNARRRTRLKSHHAEMSRTRRTMK